MSNKLSARWVPGHMTKRGLKFDGQQHFLHYYRTSAGTQCMSAGVEFMSLENKRERARVRRVAFEMLLACDRAEVEVVNEELGL